MDFLTICGLQNFPEKDFDQKVNFRTEQHEYLRGRKNVTLCRSPTKVFDSVFVKKELKRKRQQEYLRRRPVSPELTSLNCSYCSSKKNSQVMFKHQSLSSQFETPAKYAKHFISPDEPPEMIWTQKSKIPDFQMTPYWVSTMPKPIKLKEKVEERKEFSILTSVKTESTQHLIKSTKKTTFFKNVPQSSTKAVNSSEEICNNYITQTNFTQKKTLREKSAQTESGYVTVKESDLQMLSDFLQEALWREEMVKRKLSTLQECVTNLMNTTNIIWTSDCSEDILRNKIKTLETQLQVCLQKFPKDGVKKLVLQMEKYNKKYEEKALIALQKTTQEKIDALSKVEMLQEALITAKAETLRWQNLYEELKMISGQLRETQHLGDDQLEQLHSQIEVSKSMEAELMLEVASLKQENQELQYNISLLQENNQALRDEIQHHQDDDIGSHNVWMSEFLALDKAEPQLTLKSNSKLEEQLQHTHEKLHVKERECKELQMELHTLELECQSSQARLLQCREEIRQLSLQRRRPKLCSSWWMFMCSFLLLIVAGGAVLWHPPFREQVEIFYSDMETRMEDYLMEMAYSQNSGCFRPI